MENNNKKELGGLELNKIIQGDNVQIMNSFPDECIDLVVTSPPY